MDALAVRAAIGRFYTLLVELPKQAVERDCAYIGRVRDLLCARTRERSCMVVWPG
jgi:hypothetical protein